MYHERALGLLSPPERTLIKGFFDDDGGQVTSITSLEPGPARRAYAHYGRAMEDVMKHIKRRKTDAEKFPISIPVFIWFQPGLSFMEKHLLADVWELQQGKLGCFKSNRGFAVELGTTVGNVADMIYRLKLCGFLEEQEGKKGERLLVLSKHFLELIGQCPLMDQSVPTDDEVSAHLPSRQSPLAKASVSTDREAEQNPDETRMDIDESDDGDSPNLQGDSKLNQQQPQAEGADAPVVVIVEGKKKTGAAAPVNPRRGASPPATPDDPDAAAPEARKAKLNRKQVVQASPPATGAPRRTAGQKPASDAAEAANASGREAGAAEGQSDPLDADADRFLEFYQKAHKSKFGTSATVTEADRKAVRNLIRQDDWPVPDLALILLRAWGLIGKTAPDGIYKYGKCQQSHKIEQFVRHFDRICIDTRSVKLRKISVQSIAAEIAELTRFGAETVEQFFAPELEQEDAAEAEPEMRLEDMPDLDEPGVSLKTLVRSTPNIPFEWVEQKLIPHLAGRYGPLPAGKLEFLFGYWRLCKRYEHHFSNDIASDYGEARDYESRRFEDERVRAELLGIVEAMFKQHRRWSLTRLGDGPTWPVFSNVLKDEAVNRLLQDGKPQASVKPQAH